MNALVIIIIALLPFLEPALLLEESPADLLVFDRGTTPKPPPYSQEELACMEECGHWQELHSDINDPTQRIMGGVPLSADSADASANLEFSVMCGSNRMNYTRATGAIISSQFILTAAHAVSYSSRQLMKCASYSPYEDGKEEWFQFSPNEVLVYVQIGGKNRIYHVKEILPHLSFRAGQKGLQRGDLAILKLASPLPLTQPKMCVPSSLSQPAAGTLAVLTDYGQTSTAIVAGMPPFSTYVLIQDAIYCQRIYKFYHFDKAVHLCAGAQSRGGREGDSGGALVTSFPSGRMFAIGTFSTRMVDGPPKDLRPDVYTKLDSYCGWIFRVTGGAVGGVSCTDPAKEISNTCQGILRQRQERLNKKICEENEKNLEECAPSEG